MAKMSAQVSKTKHDELLRIIKFVYCMSVVRSDVDLFIELYAFSP